MLKILKEFLGRNTKIINTIRLATTISTIGLLSITTSFEIGRITQQNNLTSLRLYKNFNLLAKNLIENSEIVLETRTINLEEITLAEADERTRRLYPDKEVYFILKRTTDPRDVREIGNIITDKTANNTNKTLRKILESLGEILKSSDILSSLSFIEKAYAHIPNIFEWHGYENNHNYYEKYIRRNLVERIYSDGAVLQYNMSSEGRSIPSTFRWITLPKHNH